ncbi:unnamed protein product [Lactuca saligna]|uniref:Transposase (putative) gypsy type domain-containing protein n=1 Tax=Lactuca saligna TaxID=75948 RepID=A0AA35XZM4_LACSI|nr:unnamed protein product [Lactuca saligna]
MCYQPDVGLCGPRSGLGQGMWRTAIDGLCGCQGEILILWHLIMEMVRSPFVVFQPLPILSHPLHLLHFFFSLSCYLKESFSSIHWNSFMDSSRSLGRNLNVVDPSKGRVEISITLFVVGLRLPTTYFFKLDIREYGFFVRELTPIAINKKVGFKLLCRARGHQLTVLVFKHFFNASTQSGTRTISCWRGVPTLIHDQKSKKNWKEKFLWVNNELVVLCYPRVKAYVGRAPMLFGADKELANNLEKISINGEEWIDCFLAAGGMRATWKARGKMHEFSVEREGGAEIISLERALQGLFEGKIQCHKVDLMEAIPPPVFGQGIEATHESLAGGGGATGDGVGGDDESDFQDFVVTGAS